MVTDDLINMLEFAASDFDPTPSEINEALASVRDLAGRSVTPLMPARLGPLPVAPSRPRRASRRLALVSAAVCLALILLGTQLLLPSRHGGPDVVLAVGVTPDGQSAFTLRDGGDPVLTPLPEGAQHASVSQDGTKIVFDAPSGGLGADHDIFVMRAGTSEPVAVAGGPEFDTAPSFSPDGHRIAFLRMGGASTGSDGNLLCRDCATGLVVMDEDGDNQVPVTFGVDLGSEPAAWAHDGRAVAYATYPPGGWGISITGLDSNLTTSYRCVERCAGPTWSPDDTSIAFVEGEFGRDPRNREIVVIKAVDPGDSFRLTGNQIFFTAVAWGPEPGLLAALGRDERGTFGVYVVDPVDGSLTRLAAVSSNDWGVGWTSDGRVIFQDVASGNPVLLSVDPNGGLRGPLL